MDNKKAVYSFYLQFFKTGKINIPQIELNLITVDGKFKIYTDNLTVNILSNLTDNTTFQNIKPPEKVGFYLTTKEFLYLVLIIIVIILFIYIILKLKNRAKKDRKVRILSPIEEFNENWKDCEGLLKRKELKIFYFKISEAVRRYIDRVFNIHTVEATVKEIDKIFKENKDLKENIKEELLQLFKKWDFYKFTGNFPLISEAEKDLSRVREIIDNIEKIREEKNNVQI